MTARFSPNLQSIVRAFFVGMAREVVSRAPREVNLTHWHGNMAKATRPTILKIWQKGIHEGNRMVSQARKKDLEPFSLLNLQVLSAVDEAVFDFCQETLSTATADVNEVLADLRDELKEGLSAGEAYQEMARRVYGLFADPKRASRIAVTESSRALHLGQLMAARESDVVEGKAWVASSDACKLCLSLDGQEVGLDEPFYVDPKGGRYAVVQSAPAHPHCMCSVSFVL